MIELTWVVAWLNVTTTTARTRRATARATRCARDARRHTIARAAGDLGAGIVETVVIIGAFVAAAIIIVAILVAKAKGAAENVKTQ